jgi:3',5'-cyclic AMP phosphodiesterase CpdA/orotate phosphoribosyltransferase
MKSAILHISDLHFVLEKNDNGDIINSSLINTLPNYIKLFIDQVEKKCHDNTIQISKVLITGDLADNGEVDEYKRLKDFFNKLSTKFKISNTDFIIVPGNHDINWIDNRIAFNNGKKLNKTKKAYEYQDEKFKNFKNFYEDFYNDKSIVFKSENSIVRIYDDTKNRLLIIGINTNNRESYVKGKDNHYGFVDIENLESELESKLNGKFNEYIKIAIFHHNCDNFDDNKIRNIKDWQFVQEKLSKYQIITYIFGHDHKDGSGGDKTHNIIGIGPFAKVETENNFNFYILEDIEKDIVKLNIVKYFFKPDDRGIHHEIGFWNIVDGDNFDKEFTLYRKTGEKEIPIKSEPAIDLISQTIPIIIPPTQDEQIKKYSDILFQIIKGKKYFKSGHFHWGEDSRAHNWIDTISLLSKHKYLKVAKAAILKLIEIEHLKSDIIIGLGMEGNFLGSYIAFKTKSKYTYLPYANRWDEHRKQETDTFVPNKTDKIVTLINDVTNKASSIKELLIKNLEIFKYAETINLICLFYTGKDNNNKDDYQVDLFEKINPRIKFYSVCRDIKVEACHYKGKDFERCIIYKDNFDTVFEFYHKK